MHCDKAQFLKLPIKWRYVGNTRTKLNLTETLKERQTQSKGKRASAKEGEEGKKFKERLICYDLVRGFHIPVLAKVFGMPHLLGLKIHDNTEK